MFINIYFITVVAIVMKMVLIALEIFSSFSPAPFTCNVDVGFVDTNLLLQPSYFGFERKDAYLFSSHAQFLPDKSGLCFVAFVPQECVDCRLSRQLSFTLADRVTPAWVGSEQ